MPAEQPRKHHYLPQFYLKGFANQQEKLFQFIRPEAKLVATTVANAASERDFHRFDVKNVETDQFAAEKLIATVEAHQAEVLRDILAAPQSFIKHRVELVALVQFMCYRVPKVRDMIVASNTSMLEASVKVMERNNAFPDMPAELKDRLEGRSITEIFKIKPRNWHVVLEMLRLGTQKEIYELLFHRKLSLFITKGFQNFSTGEAAVALYDRKHLPARGTGSGFASPTAEITFPLSSRMLLQLSHEGREGIFLVGDEQVRHFNQRAIVWAERFLFAESFDTVTLADAMALHGRTAGFSVSNIDAHDGIYTITSMTPVHPEILAR